MRNHNDGMWTAVGWEGFFTASTFELTGVRKRAKRAVAFPVQRRVSLHLSTRAAECDEATGYGEGHTA